MHLMVGVNNPSNASVVEYVFIVGFWEGVTLFQCARNRKEVGQEMYTTLAMLMCSLRGSGGGEEHPSSMHEMIRKLVMLQEI